MRGVGLPGTRASAIRSCQRRGGLENALSTTNPAGTRLERRSACCMALIPSMETPRESETASKVSSEPLLDADQVPFQCRLTPFLDLTKIKLYSAPCSIIPNSSGFRLLSCVAMRAEVKRRGKL